MEKSKTFIKSLLVFVLNPAIIIIVAYLYIGVTVLFRFHLDSMLTTNAAFVVLISLSGLSFSYTKTLDDRKNSQLLTRYAGETFAWSALIILFFSILKFCYQKCIELFFAEKSGDIFVFISGVIIVYLCILLMISAWLSFKGLSSLGFVLMRNFFRESAKGSHEKECGEYFIKLTT
ncbi:MAG: hypothetical protein IAE93_08985 [Ignavibacteria bacterium]|nr:hypothetical protein [Ignavibacteria bacterium]